MKKNNMKNLTMIILISIVFAVVFIIIFFSNLPVASASTATDYDFTDELEVDRVGIGFVWTAETRTLTITGIKNSSAKISLPENSIIDIQGNIENTVAGVKCYGNLVIRGNDTASLNITSCICPNGIGYLSCISANTLTIENGNVKMSAGVSYTNTQPTYAGICASEIIINNGKVEVNVRSLMSKPILYAVYVTNSMTINDGNVHIEAKGGNGVQGDTNINGGNVEVTLEETYVAFKKVPSINPMVDWKISYSKTNLEEEVEADITDIYNIYKSPIMKISKLPLVRSILDITQTTIDTTDKTYTGKVIKPSIVLKQEGIKLKEGTDYTVEYSNNINVGTATITIQGIGNYTGTIKKTFKIVGKNISSLTTTVDTANKTYTGKAITPTVTLKDGNTTLKEGTDYTVTYKNNTNVGTATVTITAIGNYVGSISKSFNIIEKTTPTQPSNPSTSTTTKPSTGTTTTTTYKLGDVNKDGKINTKDAREVLLAYIGKKTLTTEQKSLADVNKDGKINTKDARQILLYYIGKINKF